MAAAQRTVTLFGTGSYDGIRASVHVLDAIPEPSTMRLMAQQTDCPSSLFLAPSPDCPERTSTPTYNLRCFSGSGELDVPPLSSFAAAHAVMAKGGVRGIESVIILEGPRRMVFPVSRSGQIRCAVEPCAVAGLGVPNMERLVVSDLFGIVRRGLTLDYIEAHRTLAVYDSQSTVDQLRRLTPRSAPSTVKTVSQLCVSTIVVCVRDLKTGGLYARSFSPIHDYAETPMPTVATPYLRNDWGSDADGDANTVFEISWTLAGRSCRLIKRSDSRDSPTLYVRAVLLRNQQW
ncbi:hypothetical protein LPJ61_003031 [Coemansia biformis]|uniref:Uncharacterized protein n=1 Tax=Coemansia biformis TaxID=1286918 RepID=A0A9W8CZ11_9FUNG|nr:hypothetical protein LPJ61_003031 [Coemansia biformis]